MRLRTLHTGIGERGTIRGSSFLSSQVLLARMIRSILLSGRVPQ